MNFLKILLAIIVVLLIGGGIYYYTLITGFKKLIQFEQRIKKDPNDALIKQYMIQYKKTFFPKRDEILRSRVKFYQAIKASPQVSYETKKELRHFFEKEGVNLLMTNKKTEDVGFIESEE